MTDMALVTRSVVLTLLALLWWASAVPGWRALVPGWRALVWWRRDGWWQQVRRRVRRQVGRQVRRVPLVRPALAADALLRHLLSPAEYRRLRRTQYLEVASGGHPGRVYQVPRGGGQVAVVEGGRVVERLCVAPVGHLPAAEVVLVHKLLIEADEEGYLAAANHLPGDSMWPRAVRAAGGPW